MTRPATHEKRSPRTYLVVGLVLLAIAGLALLGVDEGVLPKSRFVARVAGAILGAGAVCFLLGVVRWTRQRIQRAPAERRRRLAFMAILFAVVAPLVAAFSTYSLGFYWKETRDACGTARFADDVPTRERALREGEARLRSPFSILPELVGFRVSTECATAKQELEAIARGECPYNLMPNVACRCGSERFPEETRCKIPQCAPTEPRRLRCYGDPW